MRLWAALEVEIPSLRPAGMAMPSATLSGPLFQTSFFDPGFVLAPAPGHALGVSRAAGRPAVRGRPFRHGGVCAGSENHFGRLWLTGAVSSASIGFNAPLFP